MKLDGNDMVVQSSVDPDTLLEHCDEVLIRKLPLGLYEYKMPWTVDNARGLSWLSVPCISPMARDYGFPHNKADFDRPMPHQIQGADFLVRYKRAYLLLDMGGGKTITSLWAFDYLKSIGKAQRLLVICPKSTIYATWLKEIRRHLPHLPAYVLTDDNPEKRLRKARTNVPIHILNHDGPHVLGEVLKRNKYDIIIYDESTAIKNRNTRRWRSIRRLLPHDRTLWEMTGTPRPGTPEDVYGQIALMRNVDEDGIRCDPSEVMGEVFMSAKSWRDKTMYRAGDVWLPKDSSNDTIFRYMQPAFCRTKRQMLPDLPPVVTEAFETDLTPDVKRALAALKKENKAVVNGQTLTAVNAGVLLSKVIQICSGVAYAKPLIAGADDGDVRPTVTFDTKSKDNLLLELIAEQPGKSIVYVPFTAALLRLADFLEKKKMKVAVVRGATTAKEMGEIFAKFQSNSPHAPQVICAIPQKMSHGITATAASMTTWYSPVVRPEVYQQANNRMDRPGQKNSMLIGQMYACPTEKRLFDKLEKGVLSQADLMAIYEAFVLGS